MPDWNKLTETAFEELVFALISRGQEFRDPEWLYPYANRMRRDISAVRMTTSSDYVRTIIQCRHEISRQIPVEELMLAREQVALWNELPFDVLVLISSGNFTDQARWWMLAHNAAGRKPRVELISREELEKQLELYPDLTCKLDPK